MPTPPPPLWGTLLEEENYDPKEAFYDHNKAQAEIMKRRTKDNLKKSFELGEDTNANGGSKRLKLKKKVIYTYEYDDKSENDHEVKTQRT